MMLVLRMSAVFVLAFSFLCFDATASDDSIGTDGIRSDGLMLPNGNPLTGAGIGIGQVEPFRPGDPTQPGGAAFDTMASLINSTVDPEEVFFSQVDNLANPTMITSFAPTINGASGLGGANQEINDHATQVASVMISSDTGTPSTAGVSTGAELYSAGFETASSQPTEAATLRRIALENSGDVRAINMSFGSTIDAGVEEGNSLLTQFIDWSAKQHNTVHVVSGAQLTSGGASEGIPVPTGNYNGITVGKSSKNATSGVYDTVDSGNDYSLLATTRNHVDLLAPGADVRVASGGNIASIVDGTSFAAPHVTGTIALLQEYGDFQVAAGATNWTGTATGVPEPGPTSRRHEVSKAVIMNSADKLIDDGSVTIPGGLPIPPGGLLGMDRTVLKSGSTPTTAVTWLDSSAYDDSVDSGTGGFEPTDFEMGVGHLNAERALEQFAAGEHEPFDVTSGRVPVIGWDYGSTTGNGDVNRYRFDQELQAGSFVSMTLVWDREVEFDTDANMNGDYDIGDTFEDIVDNGFDPRDDAVLDDLSLYFLPEGAGSVNQARAFSDSVEGNLEHIFFQVETTGEFEFWVRQEDNDISGDQNYAVAWWALGVGQQLSGDFDMDGDADGADFLAWQRNPAVGNLSDWQNNFGMGALSTASTVPEPSSLLLVALGLPLFLVNRLKW